LWKLVKGCKWINGTLSPAEVFLPEEYILTVFYNGVKLASLSCSPADLEDLTVGFLFSMGLIKDYKEIVKLQVEHDRNLVWVETAKARPVKNSNPLYFFLSSGCGGGAYGLDEDSYSSIMTSKIEVKPSDIFRLVKKLENFSKKRPRLKGVHSALLFNGEKLAAFRQDLGRHNAVDKVIGYCLKSDTAISDTILVISGRITVDVVIKAVKAQIPIIISRAGVSSAAVTLAGEMEVTLVGYARGKSFDVFTGVQKIKF